LGAGRNQRTFHLRNYFLDFGKPPLGNLNPGGNNSYLIWIEGLEGSFKKGALLFKGMVKDGCGEFICKTNLEHTYISNLYLARRRKVKGITKEKTYKVI